MLIFVSIKTDNYGRTTPTTSYIPMSQLSLPVQLESIYLPPHPTKGELAAFYNYAKTVSLYTLILTPERIARAGLSVAFVRSKRCQRIPKPLADIIYQEENIKSLR